MILDLVLLLCDGANDGERCGKAVQVPCAKKVTPRGAQMAFPLGLPDGWKLSKLVPGRVNCPECGVNVDAQNPNVMTGDAGEPEGEPRKIILDN